MWFYQDFITFWIWPLYWIQWPLTDSAHTFARYTYPSIFLIRLHRRQIHWETSLRSPRSQNCSRWPYLFRVELFWNPYQCIPMNLRPIGFTKCIVSLWRSRSKLHHMDPKCWIYSHGQKLGILCFLTHPQAKLNFTIKFWII